MNNSQQHIHQLLKDKFQYVFEAELIEKMASVARLRKFDEDHIIMDIGDNITFMPILISGTIKILREDEEGREFLLYYLEIGDTCAMTLNCCVSRHQSKIRAITEEPTTLLFMPVEKLDEWMVEYRSWRNFILESFNNRLMEAIDAIDSLAFFNMEDRLYKYLRNKAMVMGTPKIKTTHYQIANDLNSSRVVISRLAKKLTEEGKINVYRNFIEVTEFLK